MKVNDFSKNKFLNKLIENEEKERINQFIKLILIQFLMI